MDFTLLIVDDEDNFREGLKEYFSEKFSVMDAGNLTDARNILASTPVDIILLDVQVGPEYGLDLLPAIRLMNPAPKTIIMTAYGEVEMAVDAMKNGAYDFLSKPVNFSLLEATIKKALDVVRLERELYFQRSTQFGGSDFILGKNSRIRDAYDCAMKAAAAQASILITGETGTGKEVITRFIHENGPRAKKPFRPINCSAIQPTMLESELFGHEAGAFTSADKLHRGLFEAADGGILFLDEISSMSLDMQSKLLRALEEKEIRRVGGTKEIPVDVQIIAATNHNISDMIQQGTFRSDLFYRLNVIHIELPPLRERLDDLTELFVFFIKKISLEQGKNIPYIDPVILSAIRKYRWPGNIRELRNACERAVILCAGDTIQLSGFPAEIAVLAE